ncbi:MAG: MoaD/ThiS family protein [Anaerolineae bacterium]|nr:MoaD/ThiS family protein [Anaerolineae bacterium]
MRTVNEWIPARESAAPQQADTYVTQIVEQAAAVYGERFVRPTAEQWEAFVGHFSAPHSTPTQAIAALRALVEQPVRKGFEVRVKLFATLRRHYPHLGIGEAMPVTVEEGATIDSLVVQLGLPPRQVKVVFVNGIVREGSYPLAEGDELGIFPPVGGG